MKSYKTKDYVGRKSATSATNSIDGAVMRKAITTDKGRMSMERRKQKLRVEATQSLPQSQIETTLTMAIESNPYNGGMALLISINLLHAVVETDMRANGEIPVFMSVISKLFFIFYSTDLLFRLIVYRSRYWRSPMNVFDALIVLSDACMLVLVGVLGDIPSLSVMRGLRMLRIIRVIRNAVAFRELYLMMMGLVNALRAIAFGTILIIVVLLLWSMLAVELLHDLNVRLNEEGAHGDCARCPRAFSTVGDAMLTLTQSVIAGDSWGLIAVPLLEHSTVAFFILIPAFLSLQLGLLNVVAAVIVDRQAQARLDDEKLQHTMQDEELHRSYGKLKTLFALMDDDDSGALTVDELVSSYETNDDFRNVLDMMGIGQEDIPTLFGVLDTDRSGDVDYREFVSRLHYLRTANQRTALVFVKHLALQIQETLHKQSEHLREVTGAQPKGGRFQSMEDAFNRFSGNSSRARLNSDRNSSRFSLASHGTTVSELLDHRDPSATGRHRSILGEQPKIDERMPVLEIDQAPLAAAVEAIVKELVQLMQEANVGGPCCEDAGGAAQHDEHSWNKEHNESRDSGDGKVVRILSAPEMEGYEQDNESRDSSDAKVVRIMSAPEIEGEDYHSGVLLEASQESDLGMVEL